MQKLYKIWILSASFVLAWSAYGLANVVCIDCWSKASFDCAVLTKKILIESGILLISILIFALGNLMFRRLTGTPRQIVIVMLFTIIGLVLLLEFQIGFVSKEFSTILVIPKALLADAQQFGKICF